MKVLLIALVCVAGALSVPLGVRRPGESPLWTRSGKWQGDIMLTPEQEAAMRNGRNGLINPARHWENSTLAYKLRPGDFTADESSIIHTALEEYNNRTCLTVRNVTDDDVDYVLVTKERTGCWSYVGRRGGEQQLNLQHGPDGSCLWPDIVLHEFLHAAGFYHMQSATNRDEYVEILWENIADGYQHNFEKFGSDVITDYGVEYDLDSVMHYDRYAFTKNGEPTILAIGDPDRILGNIEDFTEKDILKLNHMYCDDSSEEYSET